MGGGPGAGSDSTVTLPLRIRSEAKAELNAAWNWYENQREGLGDDLLGCVDAAFAAVARAPEAYARVDGPVRRVLVRRFPAGTRTRPAVGAEPTGFDRFSGQKRRRPVESRDSDGRSNSWSGWANAYRTSALDPDVCSDEQVLAFKFVNQPVEALDGR